MNFDSGHTREKHSCLIRRLPKDDETTVQDEALVVIFHEMPQVGKQSWGVSGAQKHLQDPKLPIPSILVICEMAISALT
jgi:hypothetical protein